MGILSNVFNGVKKVATNTNNILRGSTKMIGNYLNGVGSNGVANVGNTALKTAVDSATKLHKSVDNIASAYSTSAIKSENLFNQIANATADYKSQYAFNQSQSSAQKQMDFQKEQSDLAWERSQSSAQKQMDFQREMYEDSKAYNTEMSNTAYQRMVKDLRAAGLNPILAVTQGGASTPTMSVPSGSSSSAQAMSGASATFPVSGTYKEDYNAIGEDKDIDWLGLLGSILGNYMTSGVKNFVSDVLSANGVK